MGSGTCQYAPSVPPMTDFSGATWVFILNPWTVSLCTFASAFYLYRTLVRKNVWEEISEFSFSLKPVSWRPQEYMKDQMVMIKVGGECLRMVTWECFEGKPPLRIYLAVLERALLCSSPILRLDIEWEQVVVCWSKVDGWFYSCHEQNPLYGLLILAMR